MKKIFPKIILFVAIGLIVFMISFGSFYTYWNSASPERTCASCHEIGSSVHSFSQSSHREMHCKECHGTALSNGIHSLKEKAMMVVNHVREERVEDIRMNESQVLEVMNNCVRCHASEYAKWTSGGHSIDYEHVFLNTKHNTTEQINFDCLRCHGMFFEGNVSDVVEPMNIKGPWNLKDKKMATNPAIPCLACHQIHQDGLPKVKPDYTDPKSIFFQKKNVISKLSFFDRHEKVHFPVTELPSLNLWEGERKVKVSDDLIMRNCVQCHAANALHQAGTADDRTPRGVHEGLSCIACHEPHSNDARNSCVSCHPAISNCKLDVKTMNTTYFSPGSKNDIHTVSCSDCHKNEKLTPKNISQ